MQLPLIDDARSIQQAISAVLNALAAGTLDATQARAMLYGLQIAATNARHIASQTPKPASSSSERSESEEASAIHLVEDTAAPTEIAQAEATIARAPQDTAPVTMSQQPVEPESAPVVGEPNTATETDAETQGQKEELREEVPSVPKPVYVFSDVHGYRSPHRERMLALRHRRPVVTS